MDKQIFRRLKVLAKLDAMGILYELTEHPAVYTIEDMERLGISRQGLLCKNLFLRDSKGQRHFLVTLRGDKQANLEGLRQQLGCSRLSFASADRLMRFLGLTQGEVTPLGILNDTEAQVEVVFDNDIVGQSRISVHPNDNTASISLSYTDLYRVIESHGNRIIVLTL